MSLAVDGVLGIGSSGAAHELAVLLGVDGVLGIFHDMVALGVANDMAGMASWASTAC